MKVSKSWLKELVDLKISDEELIRLLPLRTIGTKEVTDDFIELDMKGYNRADLLSMRGVATEVAAITNSKLKFSEEESFIWEEKDLPRVNVDVKNTVLCSVYCVAKIENLKVEQSGDTWVKKLNDSGTRSINNVADVTNLIMLEYGQPMHAFDSAKVADETIIVRLASQGDALQTLDGKIRKLDTTDLLITDPQKSLGLAGVMGGKDSEITDSTTSILLEAAIFDPINIRQTVQRHNLPSEASKRFQHGLTKKRLLQALNGAIKMYEQLGGKLTAITLVGDLTDKTKTVTLRQEKLNSLIGIDIKPEEIENYLQMLGFQTKRVGANVIHPEGGISEASLLLAQNVAWHVIPPYWRLDIGIEEDLIEEVARMYGYEKIPAKPLTGKLPERKDQSLFDTIRSLKKALCETGLTEVQTYSFYSTDVLNNLDWDKGHLVKIANPISSGTEYLREDIWPNLLEVAVKNIRQGYSEVAIFEIGKVYGMNNNQPSENYRISLCLTNINKNTIQEIYQIFKSVIPLQNGIQLNTESKMGEYEKKFFHPARFGYLEQKGEGYSSERASASRMGGIAEVHPRYTDKFGIKQRVAVLEMNLHG